MLSWLGGIILSTAVNNFMFPFYTDYTVDPVLMVNLVSFLCKATGWAFATIKSIASPFHPVH